MVTIELLKVIKSIYYKCFIIGLIFLIAATLLYMPCKCFLANLYQSGFGIDTEVYYSMWVSFVGLIKTILIFFFLVPALALEWVVGSLSKKLTNKD